MASQITSLTIVYSTVYSCGDQRKYQSHASLAFVRGIHRWRHHFTPRMVVGVPWNGDAFHITGLVWGKPPLICGSPHKGSAMQSFGTFVTVILNIQNRSSSGAIELPCSPGIFRFRHQTRNCFMIVWITMMTGRRCYAFNVFITVTSQWAR